MEEAGEESYRLYSCARCAMQVRICRRCDRGNRYCSGGCAQVRRRESLARASARYQTSYPGACRHAARQRRWRQRRAQIVTHQGSQAEVAAARVATPSVRAGLADERLDPLWLCHCSHCGAVLPRFARLGPLRGGP